ncbi:MAG TPA: flavodoxin domain-containing protein, partial [Flavobacteriaceae bacterium]|nr:flavodoxin domain-containing protein [Flavobacteriaceae bacterium]
MSEKIGLLYATVDGHTTKIANHMQKVFKENGKQLHTYKIDMFNEDISSFNTLIIGSSIRYGVHDKELIAFIEENKKELDKIKTAFFSVNLVARKPEKNSPET